MTTFRWYLLGMLLLFGGYLYFEYTRPKPLDWTPSLSSKDKIPYGTYALFDALPQVLGTDSVEAVRQPIYNQLYRDQPASAERESGEGMYEDDSTEAAHDHDTSGAEADSLPLVDSRASCIFVNQQFNATRLERNALLRYVEQGHDVFIAAESMYGSRTGLDDTLGVKLYEADTTLTHAVRLPTDATRHDSVVLHLLRALPGLPRSTFRFRPQETERRLGLLPKHRYQGATLAADEQGRAVLLRLDVGKGHFFLCSVPLVFGNYWVLRPRTADFAFAALSYLPAGHPAWWDEYQKQGRAGDQSLLHVITDSPALRAGYYLLLAVAVLFVLVAARRQQRIIPILPPLPNTTLLFTRTVAGLYRQGRNHQQIADKKVALFMDYLRLRFQEQQADLSSAAFRERLSQKAGMPQARVDELARLVNFARTAPQVTDRELLVLSRAIQDFKREVR